MTMSVRATTQIKERIISSLSTKRTYSKLSYLIKLNQFLMGLFFLGVLFFAAKYLLLQLKINIPPALLGIAVLFCGMLLMKGIPKVIFNAANPLLAHMSLFFIPAIIAIVNFIDLIAAFPLALFFSIVVSTLISLAITGWISQRLMNKLNVTHVNGDKPSSKGN
jgi:holin-like protein